MAMIVEHKDILGNVLAIGDIVAMPYHNSLTIAIIDKLNPKMVGVKRPGQSWRQNKYPQDLVKVDGPEAMVYLLKL